MRIPKRVNAAWDWAERQGRIVAVIVLMSILAMGLLWLPVLAAFALGLFGGGLIVYQRLSKRVTRLHGEVDDLLRETGALRHRATVLASGVISSEALMTQKLMTIPDDIDAEVSDSDSDDDSGEEEERKSA